jgi:murein DD-endopeptidase MepM/ murein hydrolase activator NlpD
MGMRWGSATALSGTPRVAVSIRHGARTRTLALSAPIFYGVCGAAALLATWYLGATLYLIFRDDMLASLMKREVDMQYGYESRIAALRSQLNRETSRQLVDQTVIEGKLRDMAARQIRIETRGALVAALAQRAGLANVAGVSAKPSVRNPLLAGAPPRAMPADASAYLPEEPILPAPVEKPRPVSADPRGASGAAPVGPAHLPESLSALDHAIDAVADAQLRALAALAAPAAAEASRIRSAFAVAGLTPERFQPKRDPRAAEGGIGGPFVPLPGETDHSPFVQEASLAQTALLEVERLRQTLNAVPLRQPLPGGIDVSSPFGARIDPFLGRPALHTGVDLKGDYGAQVRATAAGRVTIAERDGGYGNMVEIDHGNGLSTRYAHLSSFAVTEGERVAVGQVVGAIGATGRATGPHLHYETRIDGEPVDPIRFLRASARLLPSG